MNVSSRVQDTMTNNFFNPQPQLANQQQQLKKSPPMQQNNALRAKPKP
jgi:hypothetical protein